MEGNKEHIGDGLYAKFDGYGVVVTRENGTSVLDTVYLYFEPEVLTALNQYYQRATTPPAPSEPEAKEERTVPGRRRRQCLL